MADQPGTTRLLEDMWGSIADEAAKHAARPRLCSDCGKFPADPPSKLCPGCEAYREHQR